MDELDSVKPIGTTQAAANFIKPIKVSSVDVEANPIDGAGIAELDRLW